MDAPASPGHAPPPATTAGDDTRHYLPLEIAHVLFMDIVGYSKLPFDKQTEYLDRLQIIVRETSEFRRMQHSDDLIRLPTGDGMALVFFDDPEAPLRCAVEVSRALKAQPQLQLRMGIHSGPVYRIADINANSNVAGGGINIAQRVMDCGDAGHILLSKRVADDMSQLSRWAEYVHDLGEVEVKHGVRLHVFNFYLEEVGNPGQPEKVVHTHALKDVADNIAQRRRINPTIIILLAILVFGGALGAIIWSRRPSPTRATPREQVAAESLTERVLNYWIIVQKYRDGKLFEQPFRLSGEINFEKDYRIRLVFGSPQPGHLYLINEGPSTINGLPDYNILFPTPTANGGSSALSAGQQIQIPEISWFTFDQERGSEKLWLIWADRSVAELEALKALVNPKDRGAVKDINQITTIKSLLSKYSTRNVTIVKDDEGQQTTVRGTGDVLLHALKLEHH